MADPDWKLALQKYATKAQPEKIPCDVRLCHTDTSITIFDSYPKSIFHFLILPRPVPGVVGLDDLEDLRTLFKAGKETAHTVLQSLAKDAREVKEEIEQEMLRFHKFKWDVWMGFHPVPSMKHLHLHVMSGDLCSDKMKNKKHYNSFHPKLGFFLHLEDVLSWFEAEPSFYARKAQVSPSTYEPLLKHTLECFWCEEEYKTMPALKAHLQAEFDDAARRERPKWERQKEARRRALRQRLDAERAAAEKAKAETLPALEGDAKPADDKGEGTSQKRALKAHDSIAPEHKRARTSESLPEDDDDGSATEPEEF